MTDAELEAALLDEWREIEAFRRQKMVELIEVCRTIHEIRKTLNEDMIAVLSESKWQESEVTRELAKSVTHLLRAVSAIERRRSINELMADDEQIVFPGDESDSGNAE